MSAKKKPVVPLQKGDQSYIDGLLRERASLKAAGKTERVKQVDAELKRVGGTVPASDAGA